VALALLLAVSGAGWVAARARYHSGHPCDWLLQDRVARVLRRQGVDPDTASVVLRARTAEHPEVRAALRLRPTPAGCLAAWASARIFP
jgi:hypothetical protein